MICLLVLHTLTCTDDVSALYCTSSLLLKTEVPDSYCTSFLVLHIVSIGYYHTHADKFENFCLFLAENKNGLKIICGIENWWLSPVFVAEMALIKSCKIIFWAGFLCENQIFGYQFKSQNGTSRLSIDSLTPPPPPRVSFTSEHFSSTVFTVC